MQAQQLCVAVWVDASATNLTIRCRASHFSVPQALRAGARPLIALHSKGSIHVCGLAHSLPCRASSMQALECESIRWDPAHLRCLALARARGQG